MSTSAVNNHSRASFSTSYLYPISQASDAHASQVMESSLREANEQANLIFSYDTSDFGLVQSGYATIMDWPYLTISIDSNTYTHCG